MLDEQAVALAKAIRQYETGNKPVAGVTGELSSRYQFLPSTWSAEAKRILGNANAPLTLENENKVAYTRIKEWKDKGYNAGQIASMWNSGNPDMYAKGNNGVGVSKYNPNITFNVPQYVKSVYALYQQYKPQEKISEKPDYIQLDEESAKEFEPTISGKQIFPHFTADTPQKQSFLSSTAKTIANLPSSIWNLAKGIVNFLNPVNTIKSVQQLGTELGTSQNVKTSFLDFLKEIPEAAKETLLPKIVQDMMDVSSAAGINTANPISVFKTIGTEEGRAKLLGQNKELDLALDKMYRTAVNDPMNIAPVILITSGIAKKVGLGAEFNSAISKVARPVIDTFKKTGKTVVENIKKTTKFVTSQAAGLNPETITQVILKPEKFTREEITKLDRGTLAERVKNDLDSRLKSLSETGKEYDIIRKSPSIVNIDLSKVKGVFDKYGINFDNNGKIIQSTETPPLKMGDISAFEDFYRIFGKEQYLSSNGFMNARSTLSEMAKYDSFKTQLPQIISRELRSIYDEFGKKQIKGLAELDQKYAPEIRELKQLKKDYFNSAGQLKDGALNKIANLTGKGKDIILSRLEKLSPGITEDIKTLKVIEDIKISGGQKVGTYMRAGVTGGLFISGNPIAAVIQLLLSQPSVVIPLLRLFGEARGISNNLINNIIFKIKKGLELTAGEQGILNQSIDDVVKKMQEMKAGLSIEDITKKIAEKIDATDRDIMIKFIDNVRVATGKAKNLDLEIAGRQLAENMGFVKDISNSKLADIFDDIIQWSGGKVVEPYFNSPAMGEIVKTSLYQEARKYKSAEEFVNSQIKLFRGDSGGQLGDGIDFKKLASRPQGLSMTISEEIGRKFMQGKGISSPEIFAKTATLNKFVIKSDAKILDSRLLGKEFEKVDSRGVKYIDEKDLKTIKYARQNGYDILDFSNDIRKLGGKEKEMIVLNPDILFTKPQLIDIWNEANKTK